MKKLIIAVAAILISVNSFAQFGIIAGLTSSAANITEAKVQWETKALAQYHVGVTYKFAIGNILAIQPSLVYDVKGAQISSFDISNIKGSVDVKTGYLELPVQIQAGFALGNLVRLYGIAEPFVGYALSNVTDMKILSLGTTWENTASKFEYGFGLGLGVELFKHLQVSCRYFWNLNDVCDYKIANLTERVKGQCNGITASVAYIF